MVRRESDWSKRRRKVTLALLAAANLLRPGDRAVFSYSGHTFHSTLTADMGFSAAGTLHRRPSHWTLACIRSVNPGAKTNPSGFDRICVRGKTLNALREQWMAIGGEVRDDDRLLLVHAPPKCTKVRAECPERVVARALGTA